MLYPAANTLPTSLRTQEYLNLTMRHVILFVTPRWCIFGTITPLTFAPVKCSVSLSFDGEIETYFTILNVSKECRWKFIYKYPIYKCLPWFKNGKLNLGAHNMTVLLSLYVSCTLLQNKINPRALKKCAQMMFRGNLT